jgi:hypothetical protein
MLQQYSLIIYTDGSEMEEKVGYSVVLGKNATKRRINEDCSIFTRRHGLFLILACSQ